MDTCYIFTYSRIILDYSHRDKAKEKPTTRRVARARRGLGPEFVKPGTADSEKACRISFHLFPAQGVAL